MFMQQDHMIFFQGVQIMCTRWQQMLDKEFGVPFHSYSGQQLYMIDKRPEKREEKFIDHMSTYDCGIIFFSVSIKY
jgi:hypothetical protein